MNDSIFLSIKKLLGIEPDYVHFDSELLIHINSVFMVLMQMGVTDTPFKITGSSETWEQYLGDRDDLELIKTYIYLKVRKLFDPPTAGSLMTALDSSIQECEWRLSVQVDPKEEA